MRFLTDAIAYTVESSGEEVGVTVVVDGRIIDGILTPLMQYDDWVLRNMAIAVETGSGPIEMSSEKPSSALKERIVAAWARRMRAAGFVNGEVIPVPFPWVCLRDAIIESGPRETWRIIAYLQVDASRISAATLGLRSARA
jgi:hypothetical protein